MNLDVHRTILQIALRRASIQLGVDLSPCFQPLWLGSWLTDMNQATAFLDLADKASDPYRRYDFNTGIYDLPNQVDSMGEKWVRLYQELWHQEWNSLRSVPRFSGYPDVGAKPASAQDISGYYPRDHFDVVSPLDASGAPIDNDSEELSHPNDKLFTKTAYEGVFDYTRLRYLKFPFVSPKSSTVDRIADPQRSRLLGQGLHVLQDFFGHSNFVELLISLTVERSANLAPLKALLNSRPGTYSAFQSPDGPIATKVMTGRFDRIDTIYSLLGLYQESLVPRWNDLAQGGFTKSSGKTRDLMLEVLFGTFTNDPFRGVALRTLKIAGAVSDALGALKETVTDGIISLFAWGAKQLTNAATDAMVDDAAALLKEWDKKEATNFARAGRLSYLSYVIEEALRKQILEKRRHLPHHTLVAKDHDVGQPEVRLAYKIACSLACDVTTDMLIAYYRGDSFDGCRQVLHDRYYHPAMLLDRGILTNHFANIIEALYGDRWWQFSEAKDGRIYVA